MWKGLERGAPTVTRTRICILLSVSASSRASSRMFAKSYVPFFIGGTGRERRDRCKRLQTRSSGKVSAKVNEAPRSVNETVINVREGDDIKISKIGFADLSRTFLKSFEF